MKKLLIIIIMTATVTVGIPFLAVKFFCEFKPDENEEKIQKISVY